MGRSTGYNRLDGLLLARFTGPSFMLSGCFYVSKATREFTRLNLDELQQTSADKNAALGVTGFLVHLDKRFFQYVEGPPPAVSELLARIGRDPRHEIIRSVPQWELPNRHFADWAMHLMSSGEATSAGMKSVMFSPVLASRVVTHANPIDAIVLENWDLVGRNAVSLYASLRKISASGRRRSPR